VAHPTIAAWLELDRLEDRTRRLECVVSALEDRAMFRHAVGGVVPTPLDCAIADFRGEIGRLQARLAELRAGQSSRDARRSAAG
jgi:hypothetical protein